MSTKLFIGIFLFTFQIQSLCAFEPKGTAWYLADSRAIEPGWHSTEPLFIIDFINDSVCATKSISNKLLKLTYFISGDTVRFSNEQRFVVSQDKNNVIRLHDNCCEYVYKPLIETKNFSTREKFLSFVAKGKWKGNFPTGLREFSFSKKMYHQKGSHKPAAKSKFEFRWWSCITYKRSNFLVVNALNLDTKIYYIKEIRDRELICQSSEDGKEFVVAFSK